MKNNQNSEDGLLWHHVIDIYFNFINFIKILIYLNIFFIVPGCGGNKLRAKLNKDLVPHIFCFQHSDVFDLWLSPTQMLPLEIDCWVISIK